MVKRYFRALHGALGVKRYILGSVVLFVIGVYEALRAWLPTYGIELPKLPTWEIAIAIVLLFLAWWLLQTLVEIAKELEPNLEVLFGEGPPYEITEPMNTGGHAQRFFRVKVANTSTKRSQQLPCNARGNENRARSHLSESLFTRWAHY